MSERHPESLTVLKLGGSVLTEKDKPFTPNQGNIERLSREIAEGFDRERRRLVIVHGAGSFGHPIVSRTEIHKGISEPKQLLAFAETQRWQNHWNVLITTALQKEGLAAIPSQPSSHAVMQAGRLVWMPLSSIKGFLKIGLVPVMYGVPAYDRLQKCSILSGDQIVPYLARELRADRIIHGTNVDGVFTEDPTVNPEAELIRKIDRSNIGEVKKCLRQSSAVDVTGGMLSKVVELFNLARLGVESEIVNASRSAILRRTLTGERGLGTSIRI